MKDFEYYLSLMKDRVSDLDTSTGSVVDGIFRAVAFGLAAAQQDLQGFAQIAFPEDGSGEYLDARAADVGLARKSGSKAHGTVYFSGTDETVVPAGTAVQTAGGLVFVTTAAVTIDSGSAAAEVEAAEVGEQYNLTANQILSLQAGSLPVLITGSTATTGGTDTESDASLLDRLKVFLAQPPASGSVAQFLAWALSVPGVGFARVVPRPDGTAYAVKVVLADDDLQPVSQAVAAACGAYLETVREICVQVSAVPADAAQISVTGTVALADGIDVADVTQQLSAQLTSYFKQVAAENGSVTYYRIAALLMGIAGVENISDLRVNNGTADVEIAETAIPVVNTIELTRGA